MTGWRLVVVECVEQTAAFPTSDSSATVALLMLELESEEEEDSMILSEASREDLGASGLSCCRSCVKETSGNTHMFTTEEKVCYRFA